MTVTAMGGRKQNRALGYATSTVKGDELARTNTLSPANALQGKVAGVVISSGGASGLTAAPTVTIRGAKSLTKNNSPIYVIDGIIMEYEQQDANMTYGNNSDGTKYGNQLKNLNPDDYESVTVLKGAAATSLYGARGANGAIVITTKSGKARKGIGIEVSYTHDWGVIYKNSIALQNEYGMGDPTNGYEGGMMPGVNSTYTSYDSFSFGPSFESMKGQQMYQYYKYYAPDGVNNPLEDYVAYKDNWKAYFQNSRTDNVSVALTGGSEKATFRLSYGYSDSDGNMPNNGFNRHSLNFTANGKINDILSTNLNLQYSNSNTINAYYNNGWDGSTVPGYMTAYYVNRNTDLKWYNEHYIDPVTQERYGTSDLSVPNTMLNRIANQNDNRNEQTIIAQLGLTAQFTDWLDANVSISYNNWQTFYEKKVYGGLNSPAGNGEYSIKNTTSGSYDGIAQLHSNNRFINDNLELDVRLLAEVYGNTRATSYSKSTNGGLITPGIWSFSNSQQAITTNQMSVGYTPRNTMTLGVAGVVNLSWKDQVYLELTGRNDWLSSLMYPSWIPNGQNNYSVFYPSVNASWVFSDTFQINPDVLSFGKLRASWAQVGKGTDAYNTASGAGGYSVSGSNGPQNSSILMASPNNTTLPNYDLKPELQTSIEFGADLRFLNGILGVDVAYYKTNTKNQILSLSTVTESGVSKRWINAGNIQNQGWELQLDVSPIRTRTVNWNISANWSRNRGKIIELYPGQTEYQINGGFSYSPAVYAFEGGEFGILTAGNGYNGGGNVIARFNNPNDPNDYRNGKALIRYTGNSDSNKNINPEAGSTNAYTNMRYQYAYAGTIAGYYGSEASYWGGKENLYTSFGRVLPDFTYGFNTSLQITLPNNSGSVDFYAQIDGRSGGHSLQCIQPYATQAGNSKESLYGRGANNGGERRVNYKGEWEYNGIVLDGVFYDNGSGSSTVTSFKTGQEVNLAGMTMREAVDAGHIQPMLASVYYRQNFGYAATDMYVSSQTYMALREITIGYNFPEKWIKHVGMQSARLSFTARNVCYIINKAKGGSNPDSFISNNVFSPFDFGTTPFMRNFSINLNLRF